MSSVGVDLHRRTVVADEQPLFAVTGQHVDRGNRAGWASRVDDVFVQHHPCEVAFDGDGGIGQDELVPGRTFEQRGP